MNERYQLYYVTITPTCITVTCPAHPINGRRSLWPCRRECLGHSVVCSVAYRSWSTTRICVSTESVSMTCDRAKLATVGWWPPAPVWSLTSRCRTTSVNADISCYSAVLFQIVSFSTTLLTLNYSICNSYSYFVANQYPTVSVIGRNNIDCSEARLQRYEVSKWDSVNAHCTWELLPFLFIVFFLCVGFHWHIGIFFYQVCVRQILTCRC